MGKFTTEQCQKMIRMLNTLFNELDSGTYIPKSKSDFLMRLNSRFSPDEFLVLDKILGLITNNVAKVAILNNHNPETQTLNRLVDNCKAKLQQAINFFTNQKAAIEQETEQNKTQKLEGPGQ